ncbi:MAG: glycosyltransferase [Negativicutes bacterium]|nr:glycosyltransferase [Negativicutes bacterium]
MANTGKVLFISAPIGSGHIRAAQAVAAALEAKDASIHTRLANVFDFFSPAIGKTILNTYLRILRIFPQAYGMAYGWGNTSRLALIGRNLISGYLAGRMLGFIERYQPSAIVCTHATPAGLIAHLIRQGKITVPAVAIVTDFVVHRLWVYPEFSYYYVADEELRRYLANNGIPLERSEVSGIPISSRFAEKPITNKLFKKLGLTDGLPAILIMGGGAGALPLDEIVAACDGLSTPLQMIVVAGHNKAMYDKLSKLQNRCRKPLKLYGFADNVHELMQAAHLVISKPGGVSSAEALAVGLPIIIYRPIPGQEEANTVYLTRHGAAHRAETAGDVKQIVSSLLQDEAARQAFGQRASNLGKPQAAEHIAEGILRIMDR